MNKVLQNVLKKIVILNYRHWDQNLHSALWVFRTAYKTTTGQTPFKLAYGLEVVVPMEFVIPTLQIGVKKHLLEDELERRCLEDLLWLEETCLYGLWQADVV